MELNSYPLEWVKELFDVTVDTRNGRIYYSDEAGEPHRVGAPALEWDNGTLSWYKHGKLDGEDGPAVEWDNGYEVWLANDVLHRDNGPAFVTAEGHESWWNQGYLHRVDGPAVITKKRTPGVVTELVHHADGAGVAGIQEIHYWYQNDELHREDGPAIEFSDGFKKWYTHGKRLSEDGSPWLGPHTEIWEVE
jgi:hypothetical protein